MKKNELKITYKKSQVKDGSNHKTLLFEVCTSWDKNSKWFFTDRSRYQDIKNNPSVALEVVRTIGGLSEVIDTALSTPTTINVVYQGLIRSKTSLLK